MQAPQQLRRSMRKGSRLTFGHLSYVASYKHPTARKSAAGAAITYEFTDIDQTAAAGLSFGGKRWGRPDDTSGVAGIINAISGVHQAFLNAGGLGILVGDGILPNP